MFDIGKLKAGISVAVPGAVRVFSAPGRVNLIGEHTDYNDGFVLPMAIERRTFVAAAARLIGASSRSRRRSAAVRREPISTRPGAARRGAWVDFVKGTAQALRSAQRRRGRREPLDRQRGPDRCRSLGFGGARDLRWASRWQRSPGVRTSTGSSSLLPDKLPSTSDVGTLSGIMDQYISALGQAGHALLIDCRSLRGRRPCPSRSGDERGGHRHAGQTRSRDQRVQQARRAECHQAVELLASALPGIRALRDVSVDDFEQHAALLPYVVKKRARHVVHENARTLAAVKALRSEDLAQFGRLMVESHRSLRDDYQVSLDGASTSRWTPRLATEGV